MYVCVMYLFFVEIGFGATSKPKYETTHVDYFYMERTQVQTAEQQDSNSKNSKTLGQRQREDAILILQKLILPPIFPPLLVFFFSFLFNKGNIDI